MPATALEVPWPEKIPLDKQSVIVPGTKRPGQTGHYRNAIWGLVDMANHPVVKTLLEIYDYGFSLAKDMPFLGVRPIVSTNPLKFANHYVWQTYAEVDVRRRAVGSALHAMFQSGKLGGGQLNTVGIWCQNRPEWQVIDLALHAYNKVGVSLYDTLGKDSVEYIISHAELSVIFAASQHIPTLLAVAPRVPIMKLIVSLDPLSADAKRILTTWGKALSIEVKELSEIEEMGKANPLPIITATPDQIATICYTSGTTNNPKGVVLTHANLTAGVISNLHGKNWNERGCLLSYLPLAHIFERISELNTISMGGQIGYYTGDPLRLLEDAQILKPNYLPSVPRILNRIYQSAMLAGKAPGLKGYLFRTAMETKLKILHETGENKHAFWDKVVFRKVAGVLGGNVKLLPCGSAPISVDAMDFLKVAFSCDVVEGYAMTENCATCSRVFPSDPTSSGTVGPPQPCNEIKLVDVPSMNYSAEDKPHPRGEVCVRGANCFSVYYRDPKNTQETVDAEGWLHTGDVGEFDSCGRLRIIDRIKNIMKLSQGEYVALEKIENVYSACPLVAQMYVHGDSLQDHLLAVVVPDPIQLAAIASRLTGTTVIPEDLAALAKVVRDPRLPEIVLSELSKEAAKNGLKGFETVKKIHISLDPFTTENGLLTPTFKVRRKDAHAKYKKELDALYAVPSSGSKL